MKLLHCLFLVLILYSFFGRCSVLVYDMQRRGVWCQRTKSQLTFQCRTLATIVRALNEHNVTNWLCYGSALAAIRAKELRQRAWPIPWESDDDLCVYEQDAARIELALSSLSQHAHAGGIITEILVGNVVRYRVTRSDQQAGEEWGVDIYAHKEEIFYGTQVMIQNVAPNRDRTRRDFPQVVIQPVSTNNVYCGQPIFSLPSREIEYVTHLYGTTWKVPLAAFTGSNGYRRLTCLLSSPFNSGNIPKLRVSNRDDDHVRKMRFTEAWSSFVWLC